MTNLLSRLRGGSSFSLTLCLCALLASMASGCCLCPVPQEIVGANGSFERDGVRYLVETTRTSIRKIGTHVGSGELALDLGLDLADRSCTSRGAPVDCAVVRADPDLGQMVRW